MVLKKPYLIDHILHIALNKTCSKSIFNFNHLRTKKIFGKLIRYMTFNCFFMDLTTKFISSNQIFKDFKA